MTESEFYGHLVPRLILLGVFYWWLMRNLGKKDCVENPLQKHIVLKILGSVSIALGMVMFVAGVVFLTKLEFPQQSLPQPLTPNSIIRPSWKHPQIGYPTPLQTMVINEFIGTIQFVGLGIYLWCFRKSGTNWWQKTLKVVAYILMFMLLSSAVDFHYYDIWEFISPTLLIVLATLCLINWRNLRKKKNKHDKASTVKPIEVEMKDSNERELSSIDVEL